MKLIVFSATVAMVLAVLFSAGCGDEKESAPAETQETQETQDAQEGDTAEPAEDAGEEPAEDAGEEPAEDGGEEPAEDSSDSEAAQDAEEISLKFNPIKEMLASTVQTEYIVMEPIYFGGDRLPASRAN